jgi:Icc-related predicted phosphoesterase
MKLLILSDLHIELDPFDIDLSDADVVVLAGDTHVGAKGVQWALENITDIPVIYVLGNHEYYRNTYPKLIRKLKDLTRGTNIHVLENDFVKIDQVTFFGCTLWTNFELFGDPVYAGMECQGRMTDYRLIKREPTYSKMRSKDTALIHMRSVLWLKNTYPEKKGGKNVIVTHHAPSPRSLPEGYERDIIHAAYASALDGLVAELSPELWIHGHIHESRDYGIGNTRILANPRGYPFRGNENFDAGLRVEL